MDKVILDAATRAKLTGSTPAVEVCDEAGNVVGHYIPVPKPAAPPTTPAGGWGPFTAEEVEAALKQTGPGRTLDEIYRDYGHL